ncbi:ion channel [Streptomyces sp. WMMB 322]|uniref:ion channel n=1 Tax=Streptomyces sp. WMMB 322 TaxID=1286821 RepID=UPI000823B80A|nr:ion channel [Streptomyces sp. WMMB 322]SCK52694.1 voltage-gated potassium channel [Streptomyces sp. WMMB 322]
MVSDSPTAPEQAPAQTAVSSASPRERQKHQPSTTVDLLLMAVVVIFLAAYAWPILQPGLSPGWRTACTWTSWTTWCVFALDYLIRLIRAENRWAYFKSNLFVLATVALPFFRPLRMLRLLTVLNVLHRRAEASLRGQVTTYACGAAGLLMLCGALAVLDAERGTDGANIDSFTDAIWWAFATVTTVGYGDAYPVTLTGRLVAVLLMIAGIAVLGVVSASLASWFIERVSDASAEREAASRKEVQELTAVIQRQQEELAEQRRLLRAFVPDEDGNRFGSGVPGPAAPDG